MICGFEFIFFCIFQMRIFKSVMFKGVLFKSVFFKRLIFSLYSLTKLFWKVQNHCHHKCILMDYPLITLCCVRWFVETADKGPSVCRPSLLSPSLSRRRIPLLRLSLGELLTVLATLPMGTEVLLYYTIQIPSFFTSQHVSVIVAILINHCRHHCALFNNQFWTQKCPFWFISSQKMPLSSWLDLWIKGAWAAIEHLYL